MKTTKVQCFDFHLWAMMAMLISCLVKQINVLLDDLPLNFVQHSFSQEDFSPLTLVIP